jgi:hemerythrin
MSQWIPWLTEYNVNIPKIDEQHEELFRIMNSLFDATWDGKGSDHIRQTLSFLAEYVVMHFNTEEDCMLKSSFPKYLEHKKAHDDFIATVSQFVESYNKEGADTQLLVAVIGKIRRLDQRACP